MTVLEARGPRPPACGFGRVGIAGRDDQRGGEQRRRAQLALPHLVACVGGGQHDAQVGGGVVEARDQPQRRDAALREVGVVGIGHQRPHRAHVEPVGLGRAQDERLDAGIAAGQRREVGAARHRVEIDVERDLRALGGAQRLDILRRAGQRPFLDAEEHHAQAPPEARDARRQRARHGEHARQARAVVHGALGEVVAVDMGAQHHPFVGLAGIVVEQRLGLGRRLLGLDGHRHRRKARRAARQPRRRLGRDAERRDARRRPAGPTSPPRHGR